MDWKSLLRKRSITAFVLFQPWKRSLINTDIQCWIVFSVYVWALGKVNWDLCLPICLSQWQQDDTAEPKPDDTVEPKPVDTVESKPADTAQKLVLIAAPHGNINIRYGNGTNFGRITSVPPGTKLPFVATAENGWNAVLVNGKVGWVHPDYSSVTTA